MIVNLLSANSSLEKILFLGYNTAQFNISPAFRRNILSPFQARIQNASGGKCNLFFKPENVPPKSNFYAV
jgi:hypothetical protein